MTEKKAADNAKAYQDNGIDYKAKILKHLKSEREALIKESKFRGVQENHCLSYLE